MDPLELAGSLDALCRRYDLRFLDSDPVGIVRRFDEPEDREIVGLLAAGLAYGRVSSIRASVSRLLTILGPHPARFVRGFDPASDAKRFDGFVHRFTRGRDVALVLHLLRQLMERGASRRASWRTIRIPAGRRWVLPSTHSAPRSSPWTPGRSRRRARLGRRTAPFVASPAPGGSVCKRSCLFLRWMVRPDDGIDCGVWTRVSPARLVLPLDTHLVRVVRALRWTRRKSPGWAMALEATARLRGLDADDPIRFDFALSRLGILGLLPARGGRLTARDVRAAFAAAGSS
jgi:hypothetical protein